MVVQPLHADTIGDITELQGFGRVVRDQPYNAELDFDINSLDNVETASGRIAITFLDESTVKLTEHSELLINEYVYDPNPDKSKMALQFASGTIRFISGNANKLNKKKHNPLNTYFTNFCPGHRLCMYGGRNGKKPNHTFTR